jgi:hypothetical protein
LAKDKRKLPKRLFKSPERASSYEHDRLLGAGRLKHMARNHEDVMQNIEFLLVTSWREDPSIDDRIASQALRAAIAGKETDDPQAAELLDGLRQIRAMREDVTEPVWRGALRVVDDSVHRHSSCRPGETEYLRFASQFIA